MLERECLESWDWSGARDGAKPKAAALSRRSELLRMNRLGAWTADRGRAIVLSDSLATLACEPWKRRLRNRREATEGQTAGLAIDSELGVFKAWSLVSGIGLGMSCSGYVLGRCAEVA